MRKVEQILKKYPEKNKKSAVMPLWHRDKMIIGYP